VLRFLRSACTTCWLVALLSGGSVAAKDAETGHENGQGYHESTFGVFVGFATEGERDDGLALGVEYEHRVNPRIGIGVLAEHTFGELDTWVLAAPLAFHSGPWKLYAAPGLERIDGEGGFLVRLGAEYGFHRGEWEISPQVDIDFVDGEEVLVIGVTFLRGF